MLENKTRYTLGKTERLKSRRAIEQLFADGKSFSVFPFKVIYKKDPCTGETTTINHKPQTINLSAAFSVSKRNFKKAVQRNRIKRLMREAYRLQKNELQNNLQQNNKSIAAFIIYVGSEMPEYDVVFSKMTAVLKRLQKNANEEPGANM